MGNVRACQLSFSSFPSQACLLPTLLKTQADLPCCHLFPFSPPFPIAHRRIRNQNTTAIRTTEPGILLLGDTWNRQSERTATPEQSDD